MKTTEEIQFSLADNQQNRLNSAFADQDFGAVCEIIDNATKTQEGYQRLARSTGLERRQLYQMISYGRNPKVASLAAVLDAFGMQLKIEPKETQLG